jgi:DNA topoisomerase 2-associated protein PAT1
VSLDGALGKIATRTRSAPRPLLQVTPSSAAVPTSSSIGVDGEKSASSPPPGSAPSHNTGESLLTGAGLVATSSTSEPSTGDGPLTHRAALAIIENLYDVILDLEQLRRIQPSLLSTQAALKEQFEAMTVEGEVKEHMKERYEEAKGKVEAGEVKYDELRESLWSGLRVMDPLDAWYVPTWSTVLLDLSLTLSARISTQCPASFHIYSLSPQGETTSTSGYSTPLFRTNSDPTHSARRYI